MVEEGLEQTTRRQAWRRIVACPVFVAPFLAFLAIEYTSWTIWALVLGLAALAIVVSVVAGERFENPRHQWGRSEGVLLSSGLGIVFLYTAKAAGAVTEYFALGSLLMVYLMVYWFVDSVRIIRRGVEPAR